MGRIPGAPSVDIRASIAVAVIRDSAGSEDGFHWQGKIVRSWLEEMNAHFERLGIGESRKGVVGGRVPSHIPVDTSSNSSPLNSRSNVGEDAGPHDSKGSGSPTFPSYSQRTRELTAVKPFDIFISGTGTAVMLKPSLLAKNREKRNEMKRSMAGRDGIVLRPGMVLLRHYLSLVDQVKILKLCRDLGRGPGGFYQPGYRDGAKLHLQMMCLGKNWDPETGKYGEERPIDGAKPPKIPDEFHNLVERAINDCHSLLREKTRETNPEQVIPPMSPNICIANFYSASGRLGLHQDRDESEGSLRKGLPVVSFSIGDTAEFLYGDERDPGKAEKVSLESGDALVFGGKSRHVFHGVASVTANSAPKILLDETKLRPGRVNLTFREY